MRIFIKYLLLIVLTLLAPYAIDIVLFETVVEAADAPKPAPTRRPVRKRRPPPPKESESPTDLPPSRGSELSFDDKKGNDSASKPVDAILLLDSSRSMQRNDPERLRDQGARLFLQFLEDNDRFALIEFSDLAQIIQPLTYTKNSKAQEIKATLDGIENEGNFTDFLFPIEMALELFESDKRPGAEKVIILLSDGHMDPDPKVGKKQDRSKIIKEERIPELIKRNIKLFSLALSEEADKIELKRMAEKTSALSWYAKEVNEIHRIFSDLFLSIKKPQVLELTKDGFEIDGSVDEATFFVSRKSKNDIVVVIDPIGKEYINKNFPSGWKWFKGEMFDVITIPQPLPGTWLVTGGDSGFAKLLSNLKLEYSFPGTNFDVGDSVVLKARLTESGELLNNKELKDLVFYNYKVINSSKGTVYHQGKLTEDKDGVFQTTITLNEEGEFKLFLSVTSPTFTRQAHTPFSVSTGLVSLVKIPANEFTNTPDQYQVLLSPQTDKLRNLSVGIINQLQNGEIAEQYIIPLKDYKIKEKTYSVPLNRFKAGNNKVVAVISGIDENRKKVTAKSEEQEILVSNEVSTFKEEEEDSSLNLENLDLDSIGELGEEEVKEEEESSSGLIFGILSVLISLIASGLIGLRYLKIAKKDSLQLEEKRVPYEPPKDLIDNIASLKSKITEQKRPINEYETELFSILPDFETLISTFSANITQSLEVDAENSNKAETVSDDLTENSTEGTEESENISPENAGDDTIEESTDDSSSSEETENENENEESEEDNTEEEENKEA